MKKQIYSHSLKIILGAILCFVIFSPNANAAVSIENTSSNGASDTITGLSALTWTHTVNACANCVLYVAVSTYTQTDVPTARVQSITYGAQTLTAIGSQVSPLPTPPTFGSSSVEIYRLIAPPVGTGTITVNFLVPVNYAVGGANSLNGVSQTTPNSAFVSSSGTSANPALTATGSVAGDLVLDALGTTPNAVFVAPNASQTVSYTGRSYFGFAFDVGAGSTKSPTSTTTPMNWTMTNPAVWALGAIVVKQSVSTAAAVSISGKLRTNKGEAIIYSSVILQNLQTGEEIYTITDEKGRYLFDGLRVSNIYLVSVFNFSYRFAQTAQLVNLTDSIENLDFIGKPVGRH